MLIITVKYLAPTTHKSARFKAIVEGNPSLGSITAHFDYELSIAANAKAVAQELADELAAIYGAPDGDVIGWSYTGDTYIFMRKADLQAAMSSGEVGA